MKNYSPKNTCHCDDHFLITTNCPNFAVMNTSTESVSSPASRRYPQDNVRRVAIILPKMSVNGVQKVHMQLAAGFINNSISVDFVTSDPTGAIVPELPNGARIIVIGGQSKVLFFPDLLRYLKRYRPTHVMSAYDDVNVMVLAARALLNLDYFILIGIHNSVLEAHRKGGVLRQTKNWLLRIAIRKYYRKADAVIAVSHGLAKEFSSLARLPIGSIEVVHNPVIMEKFQTKLAEPLSTTLPLMPECPIIGFFGRLEPQKDVITLLKAFALVKKTVASHLLIVGEGSLATELKLQSQKLQITKHVIFHPFVSNPFPLMSRCNVIALSSCYEGAPNVLIEAMACGTQVVSTDCPHGPAEILHNGKLGQLVPINNPKALALALENSIKSSFFVDPNILISEAMQYTSQSSVTQYLHIMKLTEDLI